MNGTNKPGMSVARDQAQYLAHLYHEYVYPGEYRRVHYDNGRRFDVIVRLHRSPDDTLPVSVYRGDDERED